MQMQQSQRYLEAGVGRVGRQEKKQLQALTYPVQVVAGCQGGRVGWSVVGKGVRVKN